jgi:type III secretion system YscJ/HrcJ family lipoprotein
MIGMDGWRASVRRWVLAGAVGIAMLLSGCSQQLFGALDESSANQVVGALRSEGIAATKAAATDGMWSVNVPDADFAQAVQVLQRRNLPPRQFDGFGTVFRKESLVSTPTEERARLTHAVAQELERSLMEIDGVLLARVHKIVAGIDVIGVTEKLDEFMLELCDAAGLRVCPRLSVRNVRSPGAALGALREVALRANASVLDVRPDESSGSLHRRAVAVAGWLDEALYSLASTRARRRGQPDRARLEAWRMQPMFERR